MSDLVRKAVAEFLGTFVLVFFAVGSAIFGLDLIGALGVALAFGLTLLVLAYALGPISGCHVNPAVTLGVLLRRGISAREAAVYVMAQVAGAVVAAGLLKLMTSEFGEVADQTDALGSNSWGERVGIGGAFLFEVLGTFLLVLVVILVTGRAAAPGFAGLAIGLVLAVIHLVGIPLDGTSVNPARSIGPALFAGTDALSQLWLFVVAPLIGAALAAAVAPFLDVPEVDDRRTAEDADPTGASSGIAPAPRHERSGGHEGRIGQPSTGTADRTVSAPASSWGVPGTAARIHNFQDSSTGVLVPKIAL